MPITLLLADDSVVIQKLVGLSFVNEDIEIVSVDNGDDAVTRAAECKPDIILADVVMPGLSGYEVCSAVRNNPDLANTPVLLLTGTFEAFDESRASDVGATGHITKPFEAQALVDRVNEILAQHATAEVAAEEPTATTDFFADDLSAPNASADFAGATVLDQNDVLTPPPLSPESTDEVSARSIPIDPTSGLDDLLDGAGGDHTVAIMPDPPSETNPLATDAAAMPSEGMTPTPNPDQTMLVDDFFGEPAPMPDAITQPPLAPSNDLDPDSPTKSAIGAMSLKEVAAPDPLSEFSANPPAFEDAPWSGELESPIPPPAAPETSAEFADLGLGSDSDIPVDQLDNPNLDETLLADDMFGGDTDFPDMPDLDDNFDAGLTDPVDTNFPASQGLDIDFGAPAADAIVPENANDYDVSTSDLGEGIHGDSQSWGSGVPAGVETGPAPIETPTPAAAEPTDSNDVLNLEASVEEAPSALDEEPIQLMDEPSSSALFEEAVSDNLADPNISFAQPTPPAPTTSPLDETQDVMGSAPEPVLGVAAAEQSDTGGRPDLTPVMRDRIHDTLEKVAWEAFADLSDDIVRQLMERVEQIAWEVIPQMAETLIQDEIRRMKGEEGEE